MAYIYIYADNMYLNASWYYQNPLNTQAKQIRYKVTFH